MRKLLTQDSGADVLGFGRDTLPCTDSIDWANSNGITNPSKAWDKLCVIAGGASADTEPSPERALSWLQWLMTSKYKRVNRVAAFKLMLAMAAGVELESGVSVLEHLKKSAETAALLARVLDPKPKSDNDTTQLIDDAKSALTAARRIKDAHVSAVNWSNMLMVRVVTELSCCLRDGVFVDVWGFSVDVMRVGGGFDDKLDVIGEDRTRLELVAVLVKYNIFKEKSWPS